MYKEFVLPAPFSNYIECVWTYSASTSNTELHFWLPNGTFDIVFNRGTNYSRRGVHEAHPAHIVKSSALIGQMKESVKIELGLQTHVIGIRFKAFGLYAWLGIPIKDLTNQTIPLKDLFGNKALEWEEKLSRTKTDEEMLEVIKQFLNFKYQLDTLVVELVGQLLKTKGSIKIKNLIATYAFSQKTIETRFAQTVGILPKELARIYRFNYFIVCCGAFQTLTQQSLECEYFDQSHLIREFRRFTGKAPNQFFKEQSDLVKINQYSMQQRFMVFT